MGQCFSFFFFALGPNQTWLLLTKQAEILHQVRPLTVEACETYLRTHGTHARVAGSAWCDQVNKDLPRTLVRPVCDTPEGLRLLERLLVVHAEWNNLVGYCQSHSYVGAAILSALALQDQPPDESPPAEDEVLGVALFIFRAMVDLYLPIDYYAAKLEGLIAEIETFNALLRMHQPQLLVSSPTPCLPHRFPPFLSTHALCRTT